MGNNVSLSTAPCAKPEAGELLERCGRECGSHAARTHRRRAIDRGGTSSCRADRRPGIPFHPGRESAYRSHARRRPTACVDPHCGLPANLKTARLLRAFQVPRCSRQLYCRHALQRSGNTRLKGLRYFRHDVRGQLPFSQLKRVRVQRPRRSAQRRDSVRGVARLRQRVRMAGSSQRGPLAATIADGSDVRRFTA